MSQDPHARVAVDTAGGHGKLFITGEVTSTAKDIDIVSIAKSIVGDIDINVHIASQSPEIAQGVDTGGAGDQGIMTGYATAETKELLPLEAVLARQLNQYLYKRWPFDGKTQVTLKDGKIASVVASFQNAPKSDLEKEVKGWLKRNKIASDKDIALHINPAGDWQLGGFDADAGLTGRKLIVDNYGPRIPIGGGAFSGKDPSKVDRSAAYIARKVAIDYLKARGAKEVYVYLAYAIGHKHPLEATVVIDGQEEAVEGYDLTPGGIISTLNLKQPIYAATAEYGHFGHADFPWEA